MPQPGLYVRRGGKLVDPSELNESSSKPQEEVVQSNEPKKTTPPSNANMNESDYIVTLIKARKNIDAQTLAECIVGLVRSIYFRTSVRIPKVTDLEIMNYMDKILFDTLRKVLTSSIKYGTSAVPIELVLQLIENAVYSVDYQVDIAAMNNVIYKVYDSI